MLGLFDKRLKFLKKDNRPLASKAISLYASGDRSYRYFCGASGAAENDWDEFKNWVTNWVLAGQTNDESLRQLFIQWTESEGNLTALTQKSIEKFWANGGPPGFDKKDDFSGQFWIFVAWAVTQKKS